MIAELDALASPTVSTYFHVEQVVEPMLQAWKLINTQGFGGGDYQVFFDAFARHGFDEDAVALHYIGYMDKQPVTSAILILGGGIASVYNVSTPEALRRRGFGSAITYAVLLEASKRGYKSAYVWSSRLGRRVNGKLGFVTSDFGIREYQWQRRVKPESL